MHPANPPPTATGNSHGPTDAPAAPAAVTDLPAARVPLPLPAEPAAALARADLLLAAFVVLLAALIASAPARNSDVWLHLATGRAVAEGSFRPADAPVVHSWLCDLAGYGLYRALGGGGLAAVKAALVALLAGLLVRLGARGRELLWPSLGAALAVLAMAGRMLLQPALVSALLLAVTLWLLRRARKVRAEGGGWFRAYGPVCLVLVLWPNLDDWFLLGPLTVGLCLVGETVAAFAPRDGGRTDRAGLALLLGAGLAACLLTPFHVRGLTLPPELGLSPAARELGQDPVLQGLFVSPFEGSYFRLGPAWSVPGVAYLLLAVLSGLSFAGSPEGRRGRRLPLWLGLFGLSAWSARAVPFFAVAAGPILARNLQDSLARLRPERVRPGDFLRARLGRAGTVLLLLGLLVAAWPGWLQAPPYEMRRWAVLADPSLEAVGRQLAEWRARGRLRADGRAFVFSTEAANALAWFCPAEKGGVDSRLAVTADEAADYVTVRRALLEGPGGRSGWRRVFRGRGVNHVVVYDSQFERLRGVFARLAADPEWSLLLLRGRAAVFAWNDAERPEASAHLAGLRRSPGEEAYHPGPDERAPRDGPRRGPEPPSWWEPFVTSRPAGSPDRDDAALRLLQFDGEVAPTLARRGQAWEASLIASAAGIGAESLPAAFQSALSLFCVTALHPGAPPQRGAPGPRLEHAALAFRNHYFQAHPDAPPELLHLAVRAARRAVRQDPDDAHAYLLLGEAYLRVLHNTAERAWARRSPSLTSLRQIQAAAALNQALLLNPDLIQAHFALFTLYQDQGIWDLKLKHLREALRLSRARGAESGESASRREERLARFEADVRQLEEDVKRIEDSYEVNVSNLRTIDRAQAAWDRGLAGKALDLLLASDVASFGRRGVDAELRLLLLTGRIREVREWLLPEHRETLGDGGYLMLRVELAAAGGYYAEADEQLAEMVALLDRPVQEGGLELSPRQEMALGAAQLILRHRPSNPSLVDLAQASLWSARLLAALGQAAEGLRQAADLTSLRGVLALESGDTGAATDFLRQARELYGSPATAASGGGLDFALRPLAEYYGARLQPLR